MLCEKMWIVMILGAFFICLIKGWLRKGFYMTTDQAQEAELHEKELKKKYISDRARISCKNTETNKERT